MLKKTKGKINTLHNEPVLNKLSLYPFQKDAVKKMRGYIVAYSRKNTKRSGLVYMPTGTGKTAVIAALSACIPEVNTTLVLAPRVALRDQLYRELGGRVFEKLNCKSGIPPKPVYLLDENQPSTAWLNRIEKKSVIISTIQKVDSLKKNQPQFFKLLTDKIDLVIFDEGHYEPSPQWSETVRGLKKLRIIFTATPFRNDVQIFDIDPDESYIYSFRRAVAQHYVRSVNIIDVTPRNPLDADEFVTHIMKFFNAFLGQKMLRPDARVIIRCDDAAQIIQIADALSRQELTYIAIHDTFEDGSSEGRMWRHVPDPAVADGLVWIHQHKLVEGIDDKRFQFLAVFGEGHNSARPFIQQIGRIIRNPEKDPHSRAYVLDTTGGRLKKEWSGYLEHDLYVERTGLKSLDPGQRLLSAMAATHMPVHYANRSFRKPLSLNTLVPEKDIQLPLKTNIYETEERINIRKAGRELVRLLQKNGCFIHKSFITDDMCLVISIRVGYCPYLVESYYTEPRLGVSIIRYTGKYTCCFDTDNISLNSYLNLGKPVPSSQLHKLLEEKDTCKIKQVSLKNARFGPDAVQRRSLITRDSMERTPPAFDDPNFMCTSTEAYMRNEPEGDEEEPGVWRYIGFSNSRLSDGTWNKYVSLNDYEGWLDNIVNILKKSSTPYIEGLSRYAIITKPPLLTDPGYVILDAYEFRDLYETTPASGTSGKAVDILQNNAQMKVVSAGSFKVNANGKIVKVNIEYDKAKKRYYLKSRKLDSIYRPMDYSTGGFTARLNSEQAFRVIPEGSNVVYSGGEFFAPQIGTGPEFIGRNKEMLGIMHSFPVFSTINSEKGKKGTLPDDAGWKEKSLFGLIDYLGGRKLGKYKFQKRDEKLREFFNGVELLVCDDMGTEFADFIMVQSLPAGRKNVVFIHCKATALNKKPGVSASGLAEVCSQAVKNLGELDSFSRTATDRIEKWSNPWLLGSLGTVKTRIRYGNFDAAGAWKYLRDAIEHPNTRRETWLFLGNILSRNKFETLINKTIASTVMLQTLYELYATLCSVRCRDSGLYIFCNE